MAERLQRETRESDLVARMGGDEFVILLSGVDEAEVARISQRILDAVACPTDLPTRLKISVTIGSAFAPRDGERADVLLSRADQALYSAKRAERGSYRTYAHIPDPDRASEPTRLSN